MLNALREPPAADAEGSRCARAGANDAIRALLDLAPPKAVVIREGHELEVPTAEVQVGEGFPRLPFITTG
jgi:hypothetical protein